MQTKGNVILLMAVVLAVSAGVGLRQRLLQARLRAVGCSGVAVQRCLQREAEIARGLPGLPASPRLLYPQTTGFFSFATSTDFLRMLVTGKVMCVDYRFFTAPGLAASNHLAPRDFAEAYNAWCAVADYGADTPPHYPLFFTRNIEITNLSEPVCYNQGAPFGKRGAAVVLVGGDLLILKENEARAFFGGLGLSNRVLRP